MPTRLAILILVISSTTIKPIFAQVESNEHFEMYLGLRALAFETVGDPDQPDDYINAIVFDVSQVDYIYTIACYRDGTTSLYLSTGGAILGAGQKYRDVREANNQAFESAVNAVDHFREVVPALPQDSAYRISVVRNEGTLTKIFSEDASPTPEEQKLVDDLIGVLTAIRMTHESE